MAKIPPIRRISLEDLKEQAGWIDKIVAPVNSYFEQTTSALNRALTINENFAGEVRDVTLDGTYPLKLSWGLNVKPRAVLVGQVERVDGTAYTLATAIQIQWSFNQTGQLQIDGIVGITPTGAAKYRVTLVVLTG